jgi:hypothetical protein
MKEIPTMGTARCEKTNFSEQAQRCISVAKGIAMKENADARLDSLHIVLAAIREVPEAARSTFEKAGYQWAEVQNACPKPDANEPAALDQRQMALVGPLKEIVARLHPAEKHDDENNPPKIEVEEFLTLTLKNPSTRLRQFLRRVRNNTTSEDKKAAKQSEKPFGSFREYLVAKKQIWVIRRRAWDLGERCSGSDVGIDKTSRDQKRRDAMLDKAADLEKYAVQRARVSRPKILPLQEIAAEHKLSSLETDLFEVLLLHELYGCLGPFDGSLCVRELAQIMGAESFPQNCRVVKQALTSLIGEKLVELIGSDNESCTLSSRLHLTPSSLDMVLSYLDTDVINDADVAAARRWLHSSPSWPA